ncbi:MAG: NADPH--cytochrome reductase, partial [Alphaproteobacteria bacterium]
ANRELQTKTGATPSERSTRHIEVKLPDGVSYRSGDHLSVVPKNGAILIGRVLSRFGFTDSSHLRLSTAAGRRAALPVDQPIAVRDLLSDYVELQGVATRKQIQALADATRCPMTKPKLAALADEATYKSEVWAKRRSVLDLLEDHPACELTFGAFLEMMPLMSPRYYSISSSPLANAGQCSVTVGVVKSPARSGHGIFEGICSTYLNEQNEGAVVHATIKETKAGFRLPEDPTRPIIMIGPGTGLAPFRGFLQERAALKAKGVTLGPAMLFFGCRHPDQDFIYREELEGFAKAGLVDLHVAYSRLDGQRSYVQDILEKQRAQVWSLIDQGAIIYVCGDGSRMEPDVKRVLVRIYCDEKDVDIESGDAWIDGLGAQDRYVLDVWAGS